LLAGGPLFEAAYVTEHLLIGVDGMDLHERRSDKMGCAFKSLMNSVGYVFSPID
jgi:hypothetical protein